ncbi:hypothetical protein [Micromonospora sp. NBC_01412]|uniref:hypothetical protein n=1 Tax=Micromonospora sp. NBC_01412 TaxID=2903590 RepID=UPI003253CAA3
MQRPGTTLVRDRRVWEIAVPAEPVGIEYDRLLDEIRDRIAVPLAKGRATGPAAAGQVPFGRGWPCRRRSARTGVVSAWPNRPEWARLDIRRAFGELFGGAPMG